MIQKRLATLKNTFSWQCNRPRHRWSQEICESVPCTHRALLSLAKFPRVVPLGRPSSRRARSGRSTQGRIRKHFCAISTSKEEFLESIVSIRNELTLCSGRSSVGSRHKKQKPGPLSGHHLCGKLR
jgi:hypothetical protein